MLNYFISTLHTPRKCLEIKNMKTLKEYIMAVDMIVNEHAKL